MKTKLLFDDLRNVLRFIRDEELQDAEKLLSDIIVDVSFLTDEDVAAQDLARITAERDEAVTNANTYRSRVFDFLDAMTNESKITQAKEESKGLEPFDRKQYQNVITYIRKAFENHDYLKEAEVAGSVTEFESYKSGEALAAALKE